MIKNIPMMMKIFNKLADERFDEITKLEETVNPDSLIYRNKRRTPDLKLDEFDNCLNILDKTRNGKIKLADVKYDQIKFKSDLCKMKKGNKNNNIETTMLCKQRNIVIKFYDDCSLMASEAKN